MKIELVNFTPNAAQMLIFAKSTRLDMSSLSIDKISEMTADQINEELRYIARTIPSSWEFVDYIFLISGVSRGFTHQFVRTRHASFAQQTMRILKVSDEYVDFDYYTGPSITGENAVVYRQFMKYCATVYRGLILGGAEIEDARGVLPTNIKTNILAKFNLSSLAQTISKRESARVQGEYREVLALAKAAVLQVHPWAKSFFEHGRSSVVDNLEKLVEEKWLVDRPFAIRLQKEIDILKQAA